MFLNLKFIVGFGFLLRLLVAIWNGFFGPSPGARGDSAGMHLMAADFPQDLNWTFFDGTFSYLFLLSKVYSATTDTLFWGCLLSCFAWVGSAIFLLKIKLFKPDEKLFELLFKPNLNLSKIPIIKYLL